MSHADMGIILGLLGVVLGAVANYRIDGLARRLAAKASDATTAPIGQRTPVGFYTREYHLREERELRRFRMENNADAALKAGMPVEDWLRQYPGRYELHVADVAALAADAAYPRK